MKLIATLALAITVTTAAAQSPALIKQWDAAAKGFKSAQADVKYDTYTRAARVTETQTGHLYIERKSSGESMGAVYYDSDNKTPVKILNYDGGVLRIYTLKDNQVDVFRAGDNRGKYDAFLTIGFGGSYTDLAKSWNITDLGPETIEGTKTEKLDLVSKDPGVQSTFSHVTIWIDPTRAVSIKQVFFGAGGKDDDHRDKRTTTYTNFMVGHAINKKPYAIKGGAQVINH